MEIKKFESLEEANKWMKENERILLFPHAPLICNVDLGVMREFVYIFYVEVK
tara:strand:+ start:12218 stop:12373 length:156 start_codon:yes stop_codon:yes gene_type:complete